MRVPFASRRGPLAVAAVAAVGRADFDLRHLAVRSAVLAHRYDDQLLLAVHQHAARLLLDLLVLEDLVHVAVAGAHDARTVGDAERGRRQHRLLRRNRAARGRLANVFGHAHGSIGLDSKRDN